MLAFERFCAMIGRLRDRYDRVPRSGRIGNMRKLLYFVVTAGIVAATTVALASASRTAPHATPAGEAANAYLPTGTKPLTDDWTLPGGDTASTLFSQLKQINSSNVGSLKVVWNGSYRAPAANTAQFQQAPICCPDGLMYLPI